MGKIDFSLYYLLPLLSFFFYLYLYLSLSLSLFICLFLSISLFFLYSSSPFLRLSSSLILLSFFLFLSFFVNYLTAISLLYDCCLAFVVIHSLLLPFKLK